MNIKMYIVDAFTDKLFRGNTCAVCIFPEWPDDKMLQNIALQNLFAETAFIVLRKDTNPELRWFTVSQEVDFCGYGTLSAGYVYLTHIMPKQSNVTFVTRRYGLLPVTRNDNFYQIEVPVKPPLEYIFNEDVYAALGGVRPETMVSSARGDLLIVYPRESDLRSIHPDFLRLMATGYYGYVLTSPGESADYSYRYFSPRMTNVWEDPVNGASQSVLAPFWAEKLGKSSLHGQAVSQRGGDVYCEYHGGNSVKIGGNVSPYLSGELTL
ncbi:MAG TPA: PhzF family phenazine biosynthesis protein [Candidatus Saccharimonadales bacterium]|nr:PhzF family phenazine biosynthesis protein [Candidatus Saccharimonadales bacterium]